MIYEKSNDNKYRYVLGEEGNKPLFVLCVNPSTATNIDFDITIKKIKNFSKLKDFDGWIVINVYPQRATDPNKLENFRNKNEHNKNIEEIRCIISKYKYPTIWAAWGNTILKRDYLKECLVDINKSITEFTPKWICIGNKTQKRHPRHPSRLSYKSEEEEFDIENYILKFV